MGSNNSPSISEFNLVNGKKGLFYDISSVEQKIDCKIEKLPYTIRVLLEGALRNCDDFLVTNDDIKTIAEWKANGERTEIPFMPSRVILQDFTGVPAVVDIAASEEEIWSVLRDFRNYPHIIPTTTITLIFIPELIWNLVTLVIKGQNTLQRH